MALRKGVYVVSTDRWYIERTVWLIAGVVLLTCTALAVLVNPLWIFGVIATGLVSINVALTGFCSIGNVLRLLGFKPRLGTSAPTRWNLTRISTSPPPWGLQGSGLRRPGSKCGPIQRLRATRIASRSMPTARLSA